MQRSRFDMRGADAGAGGMSISSGMGASSSSSDTFSMAQSRAPALDAAEDGHVEGLKYDVLRGGRKHSTT